MTDPRPADLDIVRGLLVAIGEDVNRDGLLDTPRRVAKSWGELFAGYHEDPREHLARQFDCDTSQMVHVNGIEFFSTCEHHMLPFFGTLDVAYIPTARVVGLSKVARMADGYARRLQIQERLTEQVAEAMLAIEGTIGVAVRCRAQHLCMVARGARNRTAVMTTTALRGLMLEKDAARSEWMRSLPA
ncbi:MAG TPA: GTP cyclohydrolase I FolE [Acidimicrobiia bacterium]|nr:GTP cyclohydrolase I FolE [Acidimicrobiia bacterium]